MVCSIFIASSQISGWPGVTVSPTAAPTRITEPGMGASSEPVRDRGVGIRKAGQRDELHRAQRGVDEHVVAVAGHVERRGPRRRPPAPPGRAPRDTSADAVVAGQFHAGAGEPVAHLVRLTGRVAVALGLVARREVAPAAGCGGEHRCGAGGSAPHRPARRPRADNSTARASASGAASSARPWVSKNAVSVAPSRNAGCRSTLTSRSRLVRTPWMRVRASASASTPAA